MQQENSASALQPIEDRSFRILAVLPTINHYGGVISVLNMLEEFVELGHHCVLATLSKYAKLELVTRLSPIWLSDRSRAVELLGDQVYDFVIATSWDTVEVAVPLAEATGAVPIYFVQDIEADFVVGDEVKKAVALNTYSLINTRIVKTRHLRQRLIDIGFDAHVIRPGMNLDIFYPRRVTRDATFRVLALARPNAPNGQRGFPTLVKAFTSLCERKPEVRIGFFGDDGLAALNLPFPYQDFGQVGSKALPPLYSWSDVYVDASRFHGFGRTGVEAMACGAIAVLSDSGGPRDYCVHEENGLMIPIDDPDAIVAAIERLIDDPALRERLRTNASETVRGFDDRIAAREFLAVCLANIGTES